MSERTLLTRLYRDPSDQPFEVWQEADGTVSGASPSLNARCWAADF